MRLAPEPVPPRRAAILRSVQGIVPCVLRHCDHRRRAEDIGRTADPIRPELRFFVISGGHASSRGPRNIEDVSDRDSVFSTALRVTRRRKLTEGQRLQSLVLAGVLPSGRRFKGTRRRLLNLLQRTGHGQPVVFSHRAGPTCAADDWGTGRMTFFLSSDVTA